MNNQYVRLKLKGVDMAWYERGKRTLNAAIKLEDEGCSQASIYLMKPDGTLWTLSVITRTAPAGNGEVLSTYSAEPHKQVRDYNRTLADPQYVCAHTNVAYADLADAMAHGQCGVEK